MQTVASGIDVAPVIASTGIIGTVLIVGAILKVGWALLCRVRSWQIELDGDGIPEEAGGHLALRAWRKRMDTRTQEHSAQLEQVLEAQRIHRLSLDELTELAKELVPNHGSSFRDEYRRDRKSQDELLAAIAAHVGLSSTPPEQRTPAPAE